MLINIGSYIGGDDIYPLACGKIEDDLKMLAGMHCMMSSQSDASGSRTNGGRDRRTTSGRVITQEQIRHARRIYTGEIPLGLNHGEDKLASLRFIVNEQRAQIARQKRVLEQRR
jgi:hypothetical protein